MSVEKPLRLTEYEKTMLEKAVDVCKKLGFHPNEFEVNTFETLGSAVAIAQRKPYKKILLSQDAYTKGVQFLARALAEEYIHLKYDVDDCTREMQNFIFDKMFYFGAQLKGIEV